MADDWWTAAPLADQPTSSSAPSRVGYIPGVPKAKDPLDAEAKSLDIEGKRLSNAKAVRDLAKPDVGPDGKVVEGERTAAFLTTRLVGALGRIGGAVGQDPSAAKPPLLPKALGMISEDWANAATSGQRQIVEAAQEDALDSALTLGTGAAYSPAQLAGYKKAYFPQIGDSQEAIESKRQAFNTLIEAAKLKSGGAAAQIDEALARAGIAPQMDRTPQTITPQGGEMAISASGTHDALDPRMKGANDRVQQMIHGGADDGQIMGYLSGLGLDTQSLVGIKSQLNGVRKFQQQNPGYRGGYNIDIERKQLPNDAVNNVAASGLGAAGIAAADTLTGGHLDNLVGMGGGSADLANLGIEASRDAHPGASLAGDFAGGAMLMGAGGAMARGAGLAADTAEGIGALAPKALAADAATGAYVSSGQGGTQLADTGNMVKGALLGAGGGAAARGAINGAASLVSPSGGALAPLLEAGVKPTIGQRMGAGGAVGRVANRVEQAFASVPVVGGVQRAARNAAMDEMQRGAFNQALKEIDTTLPKGVMKGTQAHAFMQDAFDKVYDKARSGMQFGIDQQFEQEAATIAQDAGLLSQDSQNALRKIATDIGNKLRAQNGTLTGDQFKIVQSRIGKKIASIRSNQSGDGELASALSDLQGAIDNAARRQSDPAAVKLLDKADKGYAKAVVIENAAKKRGGDSGEFNGNQLDAAVQSTSKSTRSRQYLRGDANMQEYAQAAKMLGDTVPDSGTGERLATMGAMGGAAHFISPMTAAPWLVDTAANLPGVRQILGSLMTPRANPSLRATADNLRNRARIGSLLAAPTAIEGR